MFDKNKHVRTITLNAYYLVLFKNPRDAGQFAILARQMYPNLFKFAIEAYADATKVPYGYILIDLKPDQDEQCRLRTNISGRNAVRICKEIKGGAVDKSCHNAKRHER